MKPYAAPRSRSVRRPRQGAGRPICSEGVSLEGETEMTGSEGPLGEVV